MNSRESKSLFDKITLKIWKILSKFFISISANKNYQISLFLNYLIFEREKKSRIQK